MGKGWVAWLALAGLAGACGAGHASQYERRMHIAITRASARLLILATPEALAVDPRLPRVTDHVAS